MGKKARRALSEEPRRCEHCGQFFRPWTPAAKYCTSLCRMAASKARHKPPAPPKDGD